MTKCNRCQQEIVWSEKYDPNATKRQPPNNKDGTPHRCGELSGHQATQGSESHQSGTTTRTLWSTINDKSPDMKNLQDGSSTMRALAYESVKIDHPDMDDQGGVFGTIVNAEKGHLIQLAFIKALKDWEKSAKL